MSIVMVVGIEIETDCFVSAKFALNRNKLCRFVFEVNSIGGISRSFSMFV